MVLEKVMAGMSAYEQLVLLFPELVHPAAYLLFITLWMLSHYAEKVLA